MRCGHPECGCRYGAPCCLNCPLAECVLIEPPDPFRHQRAQAIATYNQSTPRTAARFNVSVRTVYRIRQRHKLAYTRNAVRAWNKTPRGRRTRRTWRHNNRPAHAAYMRTYRARRAILKT